MLMCMFMYVHVCILPYFTPFYPTFTPVSSPTHPLLAYGMNITSANRIILVDPIGKRAVEAQAIGRAHRIGQSKDVHVERLIARGTLEDTSANQNTPPMLPLFVSQSAPPKLAALHASLLSLMPVSAPPMGEEKCWGLSSEIWPFSGVRAAEDSVDVVLGVEGKKVAKKTDVIASQEASLAKSDGK